MKPKNEDWDAFLEREDFAYDLLEKLRWGDRPACGRCGNIHVYRIRKQNTRTGNPSARRIWWCPGCRAQFSILTGTPLENTRVPVSSVFLFLASLVSGETRYQRLADVTNLTPRSLRRLFARFGLGNDRPKEKIIPKEKNPNAVALGQLGGQKGGYARAAKLSPEQRSAIAKQASTVRWNKS